MAANPPLDSLGLPTPFRGERIVLERQGIEFYIDNVPSLPGGKWSARGVLYLTSVRMVFVSSARAPGPPRQGPPVFAFDLPLLYVHGEKFNQPIFGCNNISGRVLPVQGAGPSPPQPHNFILYFMEGGVGTFLPRFSDILRDLRAANPAAAALAAQARQGSTGSSPVPDPLPASQPPQSTRSAFMDPNDPTVVYVEQPPSFQTESGRREGYTTQPGQAAE